jgi:hypothetical protein
MTAALEPRLLTQRLVIVGRSGYGKTNVAKGSGVEPLLAARGRVGIMDPTDSWYGLRTKPDGKTPAYKVVIFGGEHGDLPLNEDAGAVMGRALAKAEDSWIISLDSMKTEHAREKFAAAFLESLYEFNRSPINLIIDEAETFAPQNAATPLQNTMTSRVNSIVKRGRKRGFVPWLITQRPADVSKAVISQADALIALNLTLPHDRNAIMSYVKDHDEDGTAAAMFKAMPSLPRGEAIVWWPGGKILERRKFPLSRTFDSGKAPELGDKAIQLKPLKVGALEKALADVIADRDAKDPAKLQAKILELERKVAAQGSAPVAGRRREGSSRRRRGRPGGDDRGSRRTGPPAPRGDEGRDRRRRRRGRCDRRRSSTPGLWQAISSRIIGIGTTAKVAAAVDRRLAELERAPPAPRSAPAPRANGDAGGEDRQGRSQDPSDTCPIPSGTARGRAPGRDRRLQSERRHVPDLHFQASHGRLDRRRHAVPVDVDRRRPGRPGRSASDRRAIARALGRRASAPAKRRSFAPLPLEAASRRRKSSARRQASKRTAGPSGRTYRGCAHWL